MGTLDTILNIEVKGTDSMVKLKTQINETAEKLKKLQKDGKKASETQEQFNAKVVTAETKLKGMRGELNKSKTELIKNAKAVSDNSGSYNSLTKQNAKLSQELRKLSDPLGKNKKKFDELSGSIKSNTDKLKTMDAQMGRQQRNVGNYGSALGGLQKSFGAVATAVTGAILVFKTFQRGIQEFTDFQFQIKQVGVISGASAEQMDMLTESAKELGRTTSFTAGEVASLQVELAKLGFDPTEIENMTASALDLAFVFDTDLASAGETIGGILNSFNLDASETTRVTDVLATAFSNSALDMTKFTTAFPKVGAVANAVGFNLEDVTSLMGVLADKSLDASVIGTSLRNIFLKMADSNSDLSKALGGSVTSVDQLIPALQQLQANGTDVTAMLELTDARSVTAFASLLDGSVQVDTLNTKLKNSKGSLKTFATEMRNSLKGSIDSATSSISGFVIEMVEGLEPAIRLVIDGVSLLFGGLTKLIENINLVIIPLVAYKTTMLALKIQQVGFTTALGLSKIGLKAFSISVKSGTISVKAFNKAIKLNPIGLLVSGLTLGVVALSDWIFGTDEATESTDELTESQEDLNKELTESEKLEKSLGETRTKFKDQQTKEIANAKTLVEIIKNSNTSMNEREDALKRFNQLAGTNISNLQDEADIVKQVEQSYVGLVDSIKRKIILESSTEEINLLIARQLELEQEVSDAKEVQITETNNLKKAEEERSKTGQRTVESVLTGNGQIVASIEDVKTGAELLGIVESKNFTLKEDALLNYNSVVENSTKIENENARSRQEGLNNALLSINGLALTTESTMDAFSGLNGQQIQLAEQLQESFEEGTQMSERTILSVESQTDAIINSNSAIIDANNTVITSGTELTEVEKQIAEIFEKRDKLLAKLTVTTGSFSSGTTEVVNVMRDLKSAVTDAETQLSNAIAKRELEKQKFLESNEAQTMSDEERAKKISEIEEKNSSAITTATTNVKNAKKQLEGVEKSLYQQKLDNNLIDQKSTDSLKEQQETLDATIKSDKLKLASLEALEKENARVGKERISLALKVAKAELESALLVAQATGDTSEDQIKKINDLKDTIVGFENELKVMGESGGQKGFLQGAIFGTNEEGGVLTGEELIEGINMTLDTITGTLESFNALQQERLNTELGIIQSNKDAEIKAFEESAEYSVMTEEQRTKRIEDITKKFDDEMLQLKIEQWKKDKALAKTQAIIGGAQAIMNILSGTATKNVIADAIIKGILIAGTVAMTGMQIATINAQAPPTAELGGIMDNSFFANGGMVVGKSHAQGGEKFAVGGRVAELEGGEAVINKRSTAMFKPILSQMNVAGGGRKFADGGIVMDTDGLGAESTLADTIIGEINSQQVLLVEADVTNSQKSVNAIESRISF